ncbi:MAG: hypothetical protein PVI30_23410 [Myxococcales bacterium]
MGSTQLIDAIVRQTTVLIATLATVQGQRAQLTGLAERVFADLVTELKRQGLGNKVIADMFGLALRTYHNQVARMSESHSQSGTSVWEAVVTFIEAGGTVLRADVLRRFHRDDPAVVRGVLRDLVNSGMLFRSGSGDRTAYRLARPDELAQGEAPRDDVLANLVAVAIHQHGPLRAQELDSVIALETATRDRILRRLSEEGRLTVDGGGEHARYRCEHLVIAFDDPAGWEAAVFDHFQAVVTAVCAKLRRGQVHAELDDHIGGSTYVFDVWSGHPHEAETLGLLHTLRREAIALRERIEDHNRQHPAPQGATLKRVVTYVGQSVKEEEREDDA